METVVGPDVVRCQATLGAPQAAVPPNGGTVNVSVAAARDCAWSATSEASWMQLNATSGQGDATLAVTVARNEAATTRSGAIVVNNQRVTIAQEARPCTYELRAEPQSLSSAGGRGSISVETLSGCAWTASSSAEWLRVLTASGTGPATITFEVTGNTGGNRNASVVVGGQSVTISQNGPAGGGGPNCAITLTPSVVSAAVAGGTHTVALATNSTCDWSATSTAPWLTVAPNNGRGNGSLTLTVARNTGTARSAAVNVGDRSVTVNQAAMPACTATIDPSSASFPNAGGEGVVRVATPEGCEWTASNSGASWIEITNGRGTGNGEARYRVGANMATSARSASLTIGGRSHTISQEAAPAPTCTYNLSQSSQNFAHGGGTGSFTVTTQAGCSWTAQAAGGQNWVSLTSGGGGSNPVGFSVAANTATSSRSTTITVSGSGGSATFTVTQDAAPAPTCTYILNPTSLSFGPNGGEGRFEVSTQPNCNWSPARGADWVSISSGSGSGTATVIYTVQPNTGATRSTSITVAGQQHTITQSGTTPP